MTEAQLFYTCLINEFFPTAGRAVVDVLEDHGVKVRVPLHQTCCGQPAFNAGFWGEARKVAKATLTGLDRTEGPIVVPSGSCADMLSHQTKELFRESPDDRDLADRIASRVREFSQFVVEELEGPKGTYSLNESVAYHPSCHLSRGLGVKVPPKRILDSVKGLESLDFDEQDECCGFGGLFSAKQPEISGAMMNRKLDAIEASGARRVVSCDMGCLLHLGGGLHRRGSAMQTCHLAEVLANARKRS